MRLFTPTLRPAFRAALLTALACAPVLGSAQTLITTVSILGVSSEYPGIEATHLLTPDGFGAGNPPAFTNLYEPADIWETMPYQAQGVNWVAFDLGGLYDLAGFHVWNFNVFHVGNDYTGRGVSSMTVRTSADNITWTSRGTFNLTQADAQPTYIGQDFTAGWDGVRYVKFDNLYSYQNTPDNAGHIGLSKVAFTATAIPEPASIAALFGLAVLGFRFWRRHH
jgi:hypothetical protein